MQLHPLIMNESFDKIADRTTTRGLDVNFNSIFHTMLSALPNPFSCKWNKICLNQAKCSVLPPCKISLLHMTILIEREPCNVTFTFNFMLLSFVYQWNLFYLWRTRKDGIRFLLSIYEVKIACLIQIDTMTLQLKIPVQVARKKIKSFII